MDEKTREKLGKAPAWADCLQPMTEWGEITGLGRCVINRRLRTGWSVEEALTVPKRKQKRRRCDEGGLPVRHVQAA